MTVGIRPAAAGDLAGIVAVFLACWRHSYAGVLPEAVVAGMSDTEATALWTNALAAPGGHPLVAVVPDGTIVGVTRHDRVDTVQSLYVAPDTQRLGVGTRLLSAAVEALRAAGADIVRLWVFADNTAALSFYRRHGFTPDGTTRVEDAYGIEELRLARPTESEAP